MRRKKKISKRKDGSCAVAPVGFVKVYSNNRTVEFLPKMLSYRGESSLSRDRYEGGEDPRDAKDGHVFGRS